MRLHCRSSVEGRLSIGALAAATGIRAATLRAWETRCGFPAPERTASGQRSYPVHHVPRLRAVSDLLARGHRAAQVVPASEPVLEGLLRVRAARLEPARSLPLAELGDLLEPLASFDGRALDAALHAEAARMGIVGFVESRVAPLIGTLSEGRRTGRGGRRHERFAHDRLSNVLHGLRSSFAPRVGAPRAVVASVSKGPWLRLEMAAVVLAAAGWRVIPVGADCPIAEIAAAAREADATGVVIDVPKASPAVRGRLGRLRDRLGRSVALVVTGEDAIAVARGLFLPGLARLHEWAREGG